MMLRKGCPRCRGDLYFDRGDGPTELTCLQCGRSFSPATVASAASGGQAVVAAAQTRAA